MINIVKSPLSGTLVTLSEVKDEVFSKNMMGDGLAIYPSDDQVYAPISGVINFIFPTLHAIGITSDNGLEILIHIGIDTFELEGDGFSLNVEVGDVVSVGDPIINVNFDLVKTKGYDPTVIVICVNGEVQSKANRTHIKHNETLFEGCI